LISANSINLTSEKFIWAADASNGFSEFVERRTEKVVSFVSTKKNCICKRKNRKGKKQQLFVLAFLFDICNLKEKTEQEKRILQIFFPK
jgi:type III secretory pathway component EscR